MLSPPIQRQASSFSLSPSTPPSPIHSRPGKAVKNYFELYPRSIAAPSSPLEPPEPSASASTSTSLGKSREGKDSGKKKSRTASGSSSGGRREGEAGEREARSRPGSSSSTKSKRSSTTRSIIPPPRTSSVGSLSTPPTPSNPNFIPPRSSSRGELSLATTDSPPSASASSSPLPSRQPSATSSAHSSPGPLPPSSYSSTRTSQNSGAHLPRNPTPSSSSSASRSHHLPPALLPSTNASSLTSPLTSPTLKSLDDKSGGRSPTVRMSIPRSPPQLYSSRSVSSDAMDAMVDSMNSAPRPRPPTAHRSRSSIYSKKDKAPVIVTRDSSASEDESSKEPPARPRPARNPKPSHFRSEMGKEKETVVENERVAAWVDKDQAVLERRRRREGLPSVASPIAQNFPQQRSNTLSTADSTNRYLFPLPSPSRSTQLPIRASSYSAVEGPQTRRDPDPVAQPPPSLPPAPRSTSHIPSIDEIIKSNLAREAASRGNRSHPLPSAFAPPLTPSSKRSGGANTVALPSLPTTHVSGPSVDLSRRGKEVPSSDGEVAGRSSSDSLTEEVKTVLRDGRDRSFGWPIVKEDLERSPRLAHQAPNLPSNVPSATLSSPHPRIQHANSLPVPRARPNSIAFDRSPSSLGNGSLYASNSSGPHSPTRKSSTSSVRSVSTNSTAHVLSRVSSNSSSQSTPVASTSFASNDPNLDHAILLRSPRLTRLLTLGRQPNHGLVVSLSDVGSSTGHPIFVYLGLGGVRYLTALFDELADSMGLRLICIDRWGLGKTGEVPADRRGFLEWSAVVDEVADQLRVGKFSVLAHSAGAPYSLATALKIPERIFGSVHLLAPWVSMDIDGGYKWLKYVPSGVIKVTQAAEWRMAGWRMGKVPTLNLEPVGYTVPPAQQSSSATSFLSSHLDSPSSPTFTPDLFISEESYDDLADFGGTYPSGRDRQQEGAGGSLRRKTSKIFTSNGGPRSPSLRHSLSTSSIRSSTSKTEQPASSMGLNDYPSLPITKPKPLPRPPISSSSSSPRQSTSSGSMKTPSLGSPTHRPVSPNPNAAGRIDLGTALLRASHAENQRGTADLLAIMEKTGEWGFSYTDVKSPVKIWYGDKDDKISEKSVRWMERAMPDCTLRIMKGEGHNLLSSTRVVIEVLESIAKEAGTF